MVSRCTGILCNAPSYLFWILAGLAIVNLLVIDRLFFRLEIYHNLLWRKLGSPDFRLKIGVPGNLTSWFRVSFFVLSEPISQHGDPVLTRLVWVSRAIGVFVVLVLAYGYWSAEHI